MLPTWGLTSSQQSLYCEIEKEICMKHLEQDLNILRCDDNYHLTKGGRKMAKKIKTRFVKC
jgi:hypothetical protein